MTTTGSKKSTRILIIITVCGILAMSLFSCTSNSKTINPILSPRQIYLNSRAEFERDNSVEVYKQSTFRSELLDENIIEYLIDSADSTAGQIGSVAGIYMEKMGLRLEEVGCDDPMVHLALGRAKRVQRNKKSAERNLRNAIELLPSRGYPSRHLGDAAVQLGAFLDAWKRQDEAIFYHRLARDAYLKSIDDGEYGPEHGRFLLADMSNVIDLMDVEIAEDLCNQIQERKNIAPWIRNMVMGLFHIKLGWDARGSDYASTVTTKGWQDFEEHLIKARGFIELAHKQNPGVPEPPQQMIIISKAGYTSPGQDARYWFDRAVAAEWDWTPAYHEFNGSLLPRWGGSFQQMYDFGLECLSTERYDTLIPGILLYCLIDMGSEGEHALEFWRKPGVFENAKKVIDGMLAVPDGKFSRQWLRSNRVIFSWAAGEWDECRSSLEDMDMPVLEHLTDKCRTTEHQIRRDVALYTSELADQIIKADKHFDNEQYDEAIVLYEDAVNSVRDNELLKEVLADRKATADLLHELASGEWVELKFESGLPGWDSVQGAWRANTRKNAVSGGPGPGGMFLMCRAPIGDKWEMRGKINTKHLARSKDQTQNAGIVLNASPDYRFSRGRLFTIQPASNEVVLRSGFYETSLVKRKLDGKKRNDFTFHLQVWNEFVVLYIDDKLVFAEEAPIDSTGRYGPYFGLGGRYWYYCGFALYEDLKIRRLSTMPEPLQ